VEAQAEQELLKNHLMAEIEASREGMEGHAQANAELCKTNEELRKSLHQRVQRSNREGSLSLPVRNNAKPFLKEIVDEPVSAHYITQKIAFVTGIEDPENHLTSFNAQMIISGGTDAIQCKIFMGTFIGTSLQWFNGIHDGQITSFSRFSTMFKEQFSSNKVKRLRIYNLFSVRQREGEPLKDYLNRLSALTVRLQMHDEDMMIVAFKQGIAAGPFNNSLIRNPMETFSEI